MLYRTGFFGDIENGESLETPWQWGQGMVSRSIDIPMDRIEEFCRRWKIRDFSLFGSHLREDFRPDSDVDVLVSFEPEAEWVEA